MNRVILTTILSFFVTQSFAQGLYGVDGGFGKTMSYKSYLTPKLEVYHMSKINRHFYIGGSIGFERYSFLYTSAVPPSSVAFGDVLSVRQKSSYLFFSPKFDIGIGYRKYLHLNLSFGAGVFMGGSQSTNKYQPYWTLPSGTNYGVDTGSHNTAYNIPTLMLRYGAGLSERIPTHGYWSIILSQDFGYLPRSFYKGTPDLKTNYLAFTVGIMHKYHQVLVEY